MIAFQGRRCTAENNRALLDFGADDRDVARVIPGRFFLFVSRLMLFIDDDQSEILQRREDGAARANDNPRPARVDLVPLIVTLAM